jgi:acyl-CoA thioester hydrolase
MDNFLAFQSQKTLCPATAGAQGFPISTPRPARYAAGVSMNVFSHQHRVAYAECTLGNHAYYARYLDFLEIARGEFFRHLGMSFLQWQERDVIFPVIEARLRYKSPARYDDLLTLEVWPTKAERVRLDFAYRIRQANGVLVLEAETLHVCAAQNEKPRRLPEELQDVIKPYLSPEA